MGSLTNQQIDLTYDGLIKTSDEQPIDGTLKNLQDGLGNDLPMQVSTGAINFTGTVTGTPNDNTTYDIRTSTVDPFTVGINLNGSDASTDQIQLTAGTNINLSQAADVITIDGANYTLEAVQSGNDANIRLLRDGISFDDVKLVAGTNITLTADGINDTITIDAAGGSGGVTSVNTLAGALTLAAGTGISISDNGSDTITITNTGGGGAAGLISGGAPDSMISSPSLTTNPAVANGQYGISLGDNAQNVAVEGIALGRNTNVSTAGGAQQGAIAIGSWAEVFADRGIYLGINGSIGSGASSSVAIGSGIDVNGSNSVRIGSGGQLGADLTSSVIIGSNSGGQGLPGDKVILIGNNLNVPAANHNDFIGIGSGMTMSGTNANTILMGLVAQANNANDALGLGRQCAINAPGALALGRNTTANNTNSAAIGPYATASANNAVAIGANVVANKADTTTVNKLELQATGGSIIMKSPNGTAWTITVDDSGTLVVS